ncbi:hypothetical protein DP113_11755 [Brasilonema octagenarum UFV-E1]|uniref:Uncharacterized protein n=2 Tax=Brasilonema TaxID=383614 RepID=A0A856MDW3_9CYAN|nr:hypothetical protein [Brasilonema octagenarum UFV-OR1]QDL08490.1 hypothetical protein DP114_11815 [Brasilonema sennae CENA114]QDL14846.1 hypothetical protein DP113_11755 [Brasilonema octagenarum UFV-E1]
MLFALLWEKVKGEKEKTQPFPFPDNYQEIYLLLRWLGRIAFEQCALFALNQTLSLERLYIIPKSYLLKKILYLR